MALTLEAADAALEAVAEAGVILQVGHMRRYDPAYADAKRRIEAGEIGDPIIFKAVGRDPELPPPIYFQSGSNGMLFLDSTIHEFDLARWLMDDEIVEVQIADRIPLLDHPTDACVAVLNRKAEAASQCREIEIEIAGDLPSIYQHLGA